MSFGKTIVYFRKKADLSQKELAALVKKEDDQPISAPYLNDIEHDRRNAPSDLLIERFAKALGISADVLYHAAGRLPADIRTTRVDTDHLMNAYRVFREALEAEQHS